MARALESRGRGRARVGAILPSTNRNLEPDFCLLAPPGVSMHFARQGGEDEGRIPDSEEMQLYAHQPLEPPVRALGAAQVDVIAFGCTSATLSGGAAFDRRLGSEIERISGRPAVTAAAALLEALATLGISRVAFVSPYVRELHERGIAFLHECGIEVSGDANPERALDSYEQEMDPGSVYEMALRADDAGAEGLVLSCTEMRSVEAIEAIEARTGKPVVTSNQALVHACLTRIGIDSSEVEAGGRLFRPDWKRSGVSSLEAGCGREVPPSGNA